MPAADWGPPFELPETSVEVLTLSEPESIYDEPTETVAGTFTGYRRKLQSRELVAAGKDASVVGYMLLADFGTDADLVAEHTDLRFNEERWNVISTVPAYAEGMYLVSVERVTSGA